MEILNKAFTIDKLELFYELSSMEMKILHEASKLLLPKKKKELQKLIDSFEYESTYVLWMQIRKLKNEEAFLEYISQMKFK